MSKEPSAPNPINRRTVIMSALLALVPASTVASALYSRPTGFQVAYDVADTKPGRSTPMLEFALARFQMVADRQRAAESLFLEVEAAGDAAASEEAFDAADKALLDVCAYIPCSRYDERAKAEYLAAIAEDGVSFDQRHLSALIETIGRFELKGKIRTS